MQDKGGIGEFSCKITSVKILKTRNLSTERDNVHCYKGLKYQKLQLLCFFVISTEQVKVYDLI